jgi:hypothetical protein
MSFTAAERDELAWLCLEQKASVRGPVAQR